MYFKRIDFSYLLKYIITQVPKIALPKMQSSDSIHLEALLLQQRISEVLEGAHFSIKLLLSISNPNVPKRVVEIVEEMNSTINSLTASHSKTLASILPIKLSEQTLCTPQRASKISVENPKTPVKSRKFMDRQVKSPPIFRLDKAGPGPSRHGTLTHSRKCQDE